MGWYTLVSLMFSNHVESVDTKSTLFYNLPGLALPHLLDNPARPIHPTDHISLQVQFRRYIRNMDGPSASNPQFGAHVPSSMFQAHFADNIQKIIPLRADGSNFDNWDVSMRDCLALVEGATKYLDPGALPSWPLWQQAMADCVNEVLLFSMDTHLSMIIKEISLYPSLRYAHLAQSFCGMPFGARLNKLDDLLMCRYNPMSDTIDTYVSRMWEERRNLNRLGMSIGDDVFAGLLILGLPENFSTNTQRFEQAVRRNPQVPVDSHSVICGLLEDEVIIRRISDSQM